MEGNDGGEGVVDSDGGEGVVDSERGTGNGRQWGRGGSECLPYGI